MPCGPAYTRAWKLGVALSRSIGSAAFSSPLSALRQTNAATSPPAETPIMRKW